MRSSSLRAELVKLRRAPVWVAFVVLPAVSAAIGTFNYQSNLGILKLGWFDLWTQHTLFASMFFLHALVGVACSWLMRLEHQGSNWNQLLAAPMGVMRLLGAKFVVGCLLLGAALVATGALFVLCGKLIGLPGLPGLEYAAWLVLAWLGGAAAVACQLLISLVIRNFAIPVGVAVVGGLGGFLMCAYGSALSWPYALVIWALNSNGHGAVAAGELPAFLAAAVAYVLLALGVAAWLLTHRDVRTD